MNKFKLAGMLIILSPTVSYALFCPKNFSQINLGDSPEQVAAQCGQPDSQSTTFDAPLLPQEWNYYIPQRPQNTTTGISNQLTGTLKTTFAFDNKGKVINISVNGLGIGATTICGPNVKLGDTQQQIKAACGTSSFINMQPPMSTAPDTPQPVQIITYTYNGNPPATLVFKNGKLVENP